MAKTALRLSYDDLRAVRNLAIVSRLLVLALICIWRAVISPYDTSASLNPSCLIDSPSPSLVEEAVRFPRIGSAIEGTVVWDGVYFLRIAQCGYEYEQSYAFLPLLPLCISLLSRTVLRPLVPFIGQRAVMGLSGYLINNIAFLFAACYFYRLSLMVLKDPKAALRASILFCFNPASIFYSSIYSESLYSLFSVGGLCHLMTGRRRLSTLWLALSGSARSNGVLNAGYICFQTVHQEYDALSVKKNLRLALQVLMFGALHCICVFAPFIAFQAYGYYNICFGRLPDERRPWCKARMPLLYEFIQSHYWGVGFLRYFHFKQLPNFLLGSPILSLALFSIIHYAKSKPKNFFSVGFQASFEEKSSAAVFYFKNINTTSSVDQLPGNSFPVIRGDENLRQRKQMVGNGPASLPEDYDTKTKPGYLSPLVLPFVLHVGIMAATAFFVMHVQVSTRFLSASPSLYWYASYLMVPPVSFKKWGYLIWVYSVAYILLGSLLFSNFYPFT